MDDTKGVKDNESDEPFTLALWSLISMIYRSISRKGKFLYDRSNEWTRKTVLNRSDVF